MTALQLMTRNCTFGAVEEELIRDRVVCGVVSEKGQRKTTEGAGPHLRQCYGSVELKNKTKTS